MIDGFSLIDIISLIVSILIAMTVHEAVHAYVGLRLGDDTAAEEGRISLNPLRHIDPFATVLLPIITFMLFQVPVLAARPVPFSPNRVKYSEFGAALIAFAGPLSNLLLAVIAALFLRLGVGGSFLVQPLYLFISLNVSLFIFNLIPIPPLDGSRVLYAFAPEVLQGLMRQIESFGLVIIFALVLVGGFGSLLANLNHSILRLIL